MFPPFVYNAAAGTWRRFSGTANRWNRIVNPAMQISQENADVSSTVQNRYGADQWLTMWSGLAVITTQRVQVTTPNGSKDRYCMTITTADAALDANDFAMLVHKIEGNRVADLLFGTANARQIIVRFGFKGPAGTYSICLQNAAGSLSYISTFTISAGQADVDTEQIFVVPGSATGTWPTDTSAGMFLYITLAAGTTYQGGTNNAWNAGYFLAAPGISNGIGTASAVFEFFDVGLYVDPYKTGVAPEFEVPLYEDDLMECQRYWYKMYGGRGIIYASTSAQYVAAPHPTPMRNAPSAGLVGTLRVYDGNTAPNMTAVAASAYSTYAVLTASAPGLVVGRAGGILVDGQEANYIAMNARM